MAVLPKPEYEQRITEEDYLAYEQASEFKHEFAAGDIVAMTGATRDHNVIAMNIANVLYNQLIDRPCDVYQADMRVQVRTAGAYRYPDVVVVCGEREFADTKPPSLLNPTILVEVLSPTTAPKDRGVKLREYKQIPSLQAYLLVAQDEPRIERYQRHDGNSWLYTDFIDMDATLTLPGIDCTLTVSDAYRKIAFTPDEPDTDANESDATDD